MKFLTFLITILFSYNVFSGDIKKFNFEGNYEFYEQLEGNCFGFDKNSEDILSLGFLHFDQVPFLVITESLTDVTKISLVSTDVGGFQLDDLVNIRSEYAEVKFEVNGDFLFADFSRSEYKNRNTGKCIFKRI